LQLGADLVWQLPTSDSASRRLWIICLRADGLGGGQPEWLWDIKKEADLRQKQVLFVALGNRGDAELLLRLQQDPQLADCLFMEARWPEACVSSAQVFADAELVISMRYHGLVLGALAGAVVTGFGADPKLAVLLEELGQRVLSVQSPVSQLRQILAELPALTAVLLHRRAWLRQRSQEAVAAAQSWIAGVLRTGA
ncbi:hypothetical protein JW933_07325, partial [candidate division FCPU426 bacterium]|nr:hypothetical protein [candidate division FCPU426 bacterium]